LPNKAQPVPDFLSTTDVGRGVPPSAEHDGAEGAEGRGEERRQEAERLGAEEDEERLLFFATPSTIAPAGEE